MLRKPRIEKRESPILYGRPIHINREAITDEGRTVPVTFSSDEPVLVSDGFDTFYEILDHSPGSIRLNRAKKGLALLKEHTDTLLGRVNDISFGQEGSINVGKGSARFARTDEARGQLELVRDGVLTDVSVGYRVFKRVSEGELEGFPLLRAVDWMPSEVSTVPIGADDVAGFRADKGPNELTIDWRNNEMEKCKLCGKEHAELNTRGACPDCIAEMTRAATPPAAPVPAAPVPVAPEQRHAPAAEPVVDEARVLVLEGEVRKTEEDRTAEIRAIGEQFHMEALASTAIAARKPADEFRKEVMEVLSKNSTGGMITSDKLGMNDKERNEYSIDKAILHMLGEKGYEKCFEREIHEDLTKRYEQQGSGIMIPTDQMIPRNFKGQMQRTTMIAGTDSLGGYLVETQQLPERFLDFLRAKTVLGEMGATILEGLVGNIVWPTQATDPTVNWLATETGALTESNLTFAQNAMNPKIATIKHSWSRQLARQSNPSIENVSRNGFMNKFAVEVDRIGINGKTANNEPVGILNTSGIGAVEMGTDGGALTWPGVIGLETEVAVDNADIGALGYITNPKVRGAGKGTLKSANVSGYIWQERMLIEAAEMLNGFRAAVTTNVPSNLTKGSSAAIMSALIYGNFLDAIFGFWGAMEIEEDRITNADSGGGIILRLFHMLDFLLDRAQSFSAIKDIDTTSA